MGEAMKQMAEVKFALEDNVKQNFLEPLTHLQNKDVRDVMVRWEEKVFARVGFFVNAASFSISFSLFQHHRKKLESRRLDFDCKKSKRNIGGSVAETKVAEDKFEESFNLASMGMHNLLQNETEQISQLAAFSEALFEYHSQCASILESLTQRLMEQ